VQAKPLGRQSTLLKGSVERSKPRASPPKDVQVDFFGETAGGAGRVSIKGEQSLQLRFRITDFFRVGEVLSDADDALQCRRVGDKPGFKLLDDDYRNYRKAVFRGKPTFYCTHKLCWILAITVRNDQYSFRPV
jgi:hypothetical protein